MEFDRFLVVERKYRARGTKPNAICGHEVLAWFLEREAARVFVEAHKWLPLRIYKLVERSEEE